MQRQFTDDGFEFDRLILLGGAVRGLSDIGEVLAALDLVTDGDDESWIAAFTVLAERLHRHAQASARAGHVQSARAAHLRAANYFATAASHAVGTADDARVRTLWNHHRDAWDAAVAAFDPPVDQVEIPFEGTTLAGYFFHASGADGTPRPTVICNNGSDGPVTDMWSYGAAAAVERGWNAITFDGPGQGAALYRQNLYFRAEWETVVTPVVDFLVARPDVDASRIALHGVSQAGFWVPRAAAFEHRLAAAVADPGVLRVGDSWRQHLPDVMLELLDQGDQKDFDAFMEAGLKDDPKALAEIRWRMDPYGTTSFFEAYRAAEAMTLDAEILGQITCPVLITAPDHEQFWPKQSHEMHELLPGSTLMRFLDAEGASWHCEPAAHLLRDERVFDWLADVFAAIG